MKQQNTLQPKLRFPEIEGDWEKINLSEIAEIKGTKNKLNEILPVLTNSAEKGVIKQEDFFDNQIANDKNLDSYYILDIGEFVYNPRISKHAPYGPINLNKLEKGLLSPLYSIFSLKKENTLNFFLEIYFKTTLWHKYMFIEGNQGARSDRMAVGKDTLSRLPISIPSLPEQQKIADYLSTIDNKINLLEEKKAQLALYKKAMMQKLFSQEIRFKPTQCHTEPVEVEPVEVELMETYPEWEEKRLGDISKITTGKLDANAMIPNGEYRFYTCAKEYYKIDKYAFDCEALLISGNGANVGYIHHYKGKFNAYQRTYVLTDLAQNFEFIKYQLDQFLHIRISREKKEGNTPYIVLSTLTEMLLKIPIKQEQQKIADFLSAIDESIEKVNEQISQTQSFKKAMLQQMFV